MATEYKRFYSSRLFDLPQESTVMKEVTIAHEHMELNLIECNYERLHTLRKCLHHFAHVITILFVVDLTSFQQGISDESFQNSMLENLSSFKFISNKSYFQETTII